MKTYTRLLAGVALVTALAATSGCVIRQERIAGPAAASSSTESVALDGAERARVHIAIGAGELAVQGEPLGGDLLQGTFDYTPAQLKPEVRSDASAGKLNVEVNHPSLQGLNLGGRISSDWDVRLAEGVPIDLQIRMGAGDSDLDLVGLDLSALSVEMGAGQSKIDLSGPRENDLRGAITAGAGELTIRLPEEIGVRVSGRKDGIGEWTYDGFTQDGDYLVNDAYATATTVIELDVQRGIGTVTLELVD